MNPPSMQTKGVGTRKHVHAIMLCKDLTNGKLDETHTTMRGRGFSIENITDDLTKQFTFTEFNKSYALYKDGDTEYLRFEGSLMGEQIKLTLDVFSCYCEPLNENQEPPF